MAIRYWRSGDDGDGIFPAGTRGLDDDTYGGDLFLRANRGVAVAAAAASIFTASLGYGICQDREEIPAGKLYAVPDELYWQNPVAPVAASLFQVLPYRPDPEEIPAGKLYGCPTDDYWQNPVAPVPASMFVQLPYLPDTEEIPAGKLYGAPTDDYWQVPLGQAAPPLARLFTDTDDLPIAVAAFQPDEDSWQSVIAWPAAAFRPIPTDLDDLPAASLSGQPDEDYWQNQVVPQQATLYLRLPLGDPEEVPAGSLSGQPDEDFWANPVAPVPATLYQRLPLGDPEELPAGALYGQPDEDYWQAPVLVLARFAPVLFADPDDLPIAGAAPFWLDEDYAYSALPAMLLATFYQPLPYLPDPEEIPANVSGWVQPPPAQGAVSTAIFVFDD
jgi:hypothetical protein